MSYGRIVLEKRYSKDPSNPLSNGGALLTMVAEMLDIAYEKGIEEGLSDLRTVWLNMKSRKYGQKKMLLRYLDNAIKRLTERLSPEAQKDMAARFGDKPKKAQRRRG